MDDGSLVYDVSPAREDSDHLDVRLHLYSPFQFSQWEWYGKYSQGVVISLNDAWSMTQELKAGENTVDAALPRGSLKPRGNILSVTFRYQAWLPLVRAWEIGGFLDGIELL